MTIAAAHTDRVHANHQKVLTLKPVCEISSTGETLMLLTVAHNPTLQMIRWLSHARGSSDVYDLHEPADM
jgi:hypothetical protein